MLAILALGSAATTADAQLERFRDSATKRWGYRRPDRSVAISARYIGAGHFKQGRAAVQDSTGFAIINTLGAVVERLREDSVAAGSASVPPPSRACSFVGSERMPSPGFECYVRQLRGHGVVAGGEIARSPEQGEGYSAAVALKLHLGVVVIEEIGYEGFRRRLLLPGVDSARAMRWRRILYPDVPAREEGCSESWTVGTIKGGAFIEQRSEC